MRFAAPFRKLRGVEKVLKYCTDDFRRTQMQENNIMLDQATTIRPGEELPLSDLQNYLQKALDGFDAIKAIQQFPGGYSNLTYLVQTNQGDYVLRRPPIGANIKSAHDMGREYRVLSLLQPVYQKIPEPILYCEKEDIIGAPFYLMERVEGVILRAKPPKNVSLTPELMRGLSKAAIDNLVQLHRLDIEKTGLAQLGKPEGYIERQIHGWIKRYYKAETDTIESMNEVAEWMQHHLPEPQPPALIHNDYKYDNLVLHPENLIEIRAVLDWEMTTVGDPLMDLGTTLGYWSEPEDVKNVPLAASNLTYLPGNFSRREVVNYYGEQSGRDVSNILFYYVYGAFKIAVIVQQIYARYKKGLTQDARFANLGQAVQYFGNTARKAIETDDF